MHLVLATQRPAGVVSADIRANTNLRIALRVTDARRVAGRHRRARLGGIAKSTPGRAYVRSGAQSLVGVQSARIGGRRPGAGPVAASAGRDGPLGGLRARGARCRRRRRDADDGTMVTDLAVLVDAIAAADRWASASRAGRGWSRCPRSSRSASCPRPGPAPGSRLRARLRRGASPAGDVLPVPYGLTDLPAQQARAPLSVDLVTATTP